MDRIYESGASETAPSVPASPSSGYPSSGNASTGVSATKPGPYWYHMITEEIRKVISGCGIAPAYNAVNQLWSALQEKFAPKESPSFTGTPAAPTPGAADNSTRIATTAWLYAAMATVMTYFGFAISLVTNGYIKFPSILGGMIIQWGSGVANASGVVAQSLPIAFPTNHIIGFGVTQNGSAIVGVVTLKTLTVSTIDAVVINGSGSPVGGATINWLAFGR